MLSAIDRGERCILVTGAAGIGKTRLSYEATSLLESSRGDIPFVALHHCRTPDDVLSAVAKAIDFRFDRSGPGSSHIDELGLCLSEAAISVLVLDNAEQVASDVSEVVLRLSVVTQTQFIVTSTARIDVPGAWEIRLAPLAVPTPPFTEERVRTSSAFELLWQRALAVRPEQASEEMSWARLGSLVVRLDGIPLAIELAAARLRLLDFEELSRRLSDDLSLLSRKHPDSLTSRSGLEAAFLSTWSSLSQAQRAVLTQCTVFRDGFTVRAAEAVVALEPGGAQSTLDLLDDLLDRSLLEASGSGSSLRLGILRVIGELVGQHCETPELLADATSRHATYYSQFCEALFESASDDASDEQHNIEQALATCREHPKANQRAICTLSSVLEPVLSRATPCRKVAALVEAIRKELAPADVDARQLIQLILGQSRALVGLGRTEEASAALTDAAALAYSLPDIGYRVEVQLAQIDQQHAIQHQPNAAATQALYRDAEEMDDDHLLNRIRLRRAEANLLLGQPTVALADFEKVLSGDVTVWLDDEFRFWALYANALRVTGRMDEAHKAYETGLSWAEARGDVRRLASLSQLLGASLSHEYHQRKRARNLLHRARRLNRALGQELDVALNTMRLAWLALDIEDWDQAKLLLDEATVRIFSSDSPTYQAAVVGQQAVLSWFQGESAAAIDAAGKAVDLAASRANPIQMTVRTCFQASILFATGHPSEGHKALESGRSFGGSLEHETAVMVLRLAELFAGWFGDQLSETDLALGLLPIISPKWDDHDRYPWGGPSHYARSVHVRSLGKRLLQLQTPALQSRIDAMALASGSQSLVCAENGESYRTQGGEWVDLSGKKHLSKLLAMLIQQRRLGGVEMTLEDVIETLWPGDQSDRQSLKNRAYFTLSTLRKTGLKDVLLTTKRRYQLDPDIPLFVW